jgi:fluoride exporter
MRLVLAIGLGSFVGGSSRYLLSQFVNSRLGSDFPAGTFAVNIIGSFLIGIIMALFERDMISDDWRIFLATGIMGGFTTFSAFSLEAVRLIRGGETSVAITYVVATVIAGLISTAAGFLLVKAV